MKWDKECSHLVQPLQPLQTKDISFLSGAQPGAWEPAVCRGYWLCGCCFPLSVSSKSEYVSQMGHWHDTVTRRLFWLRMPSTTVTHRTCKPTRKQLRPLLPPLLTLEIQFHRCRNAHSTHKSICRSSDYQHSPPDCPAPQPFTPHL